MLFSFVVTQHNTWDAHVLALFFAANASVSSPSYSSDQDPSVHHHTTTEYLF